ncbi:unnamed protein product [Trifolium pratense]|uniref:Uncharacterized protein n=1 Tax=Trifolium pratense TaxID=57577 RepID=A0ACB0J1W0_TRIPR|nr:unnamed protein product [Trifolium pratense]
MEEDLDFGKKVSINDTMEVIDPTKIVLLLRAFLEIQQRRAQAYSKLKSGITKEFNDCSKEVREMESLFQSPDYSRVDLAQILRAVQDQEKQKLHLTATIQLLKKAGRPSERLVSHENCKFTKSTEHECVHVKEITEASGTEEAEADAEFDNALNEAIRGVQDAVMAINEHLEEVRYEIAALEAE